MPAHAQIAHVIEENDSDFAVGALQQLLDEIGLCLVRRLITVRRSITVRGR